jgi:hypothetical protein
MVSEISHAQEDEYYMISLITESKIIKLIEAESAMAGWWEESEELCQRIQSSVMQNECASSTLICSS